jgi:hypothetical protein
LDYMWPIKEAKYLAGTNIRAQPRLFAKQFSHIGGKVGECWIFLDIYDGN